MAFVTKGIQDIQFCKVLETRTGPGGIQYVHIAKPSDDPLVCPQTSIQLDGGNVYSGTINFTFPSDGSDGVSAIGEPIYSAQIICRNGYQSDTSPETGPSFDFKSWNNQYGILFSKDLDVALARISPQTYTTVASEYSGKLTTNEVRAVNILCDSLSTFSGSYLSTTHFNADIFVAGGINTVGLSASGGTYLAGTHITGDLAVSGTTTSADAHITNTLYAGGNVTLGPIDCYGNASFLHGTINGIDATFSGNITSTNLTVSGEAHLGLGLSVNDTTTGELTVTGGATLGRLYVLGITNTQDITAGNITAENITATNVGTKLTAREIEVNTDLTVHGVSQLYTTSISGNCDLMYTTVHRDLTIGPGYSLYVLGGSGTFSGDVTCQKLTAYGVVNFSSDLYMGNYTTANLNAISCSHDALISGNLTAGGLSVYGPITINSSSVPTSAQQGYQISNVLAANTTINTTGVTLCSVTLPTGTWMISGFVGTVGTTGLQFCLSMNANTPPYTTNASYLQYAWSGSGTNSHMNFIQYISSSLTLYLYAVIASGTTTALATQTAIIATRLN